MHPIRSLAVVAVLTTAALAQTPATEPAVNRIGPTSAPATRSADEADVRAAIVTYNAAVNAGDTAKLVDFVSVSTPIQKSALTLMTRLTTVGRDMYSAIKDKFGEKEMAAGGVDKSSFPAGFPELPADQIDVRVNGDHASLLVRSSADAPPLGMKKTATGWKLDGDALLPAMTDKQLTEQGAVLGAATDEIQQTAADVRAGHFRSPDEAVLVMNHRVQNAVRTAQAKLAAQDAATQPTTMP